MNLLAIIMLTFLSAIVTPTKSWFAPSQPWTVQVKGAQPGTRLVMANFIGKYVTTPGSTNITGDQLVDLKKLFPAIGLTPDTYLLYTVKDGGKDASHFIGTPLVIDVREDDRRPGSGPMVMRVRPLEYAVINMDAGPMMALFYYDVAPRTVDNFISLARSGFYDGLTFHRIVPGFIIQGGDPTGTGTGGPGYHVEAEFNDRNHLPGVLSMARSPDPNEAAGALPRAEFADSAGSQFFICLDYTHTRTLDHRYTTFARIIDGMEVVDSLAKLPIASPATGRPVNPPIIRSILILPVTADHNPYASLVKMENVPTTAPISADAKAQAEAATKPTTEVPINAPKREPVPKTP
ncbi:MAG TPA: peptidylprolyl isomerase [Tepidisphaeraceae bacterium]|jgi:peptidyl-prolyl cis-trans isomerase B (cyclophilin B)|nr:peptidylprolyl isomerase [Tepidisphaeraceae bacterium]